MIEVSVASAEVIVNEVAAVLAVTPTAFGTVTVPNDCIDNIMRLLAVTLVVDTVNVPATSVAVPIVQLEPSRITAPSEVFILFLTADELVM